MATSMCVGGPIQQPWGCSNTSLAAGRHRVVGGSQKREAGQQGPLWEGLCLLPMSESTKVRPSARTEHLTLHSSEASKEDSQPELTQKAQKLASQPRDWQGAHLLQCQKAEGFPLLEVQLRAVWRRGGQMVGGGSGGTRKFLQVLPFPMSFEQED